MVDHGDDAAIIQAGRAQDADHAHDLARRIGIRRGDDGRSRQAEKAVLRADENAHSIALLGQFQQADQVILALNILE